MLNRKYLLFLNACLLANSSLNAKEIKLTLDYSSDIPFSSYNIHTPHIPVELKPISADNIFGIKTAAVCSLASGLCGVSGDIDLRHNNEQMCKDSGYSQTCPEGEKADAHDLCPYDSSYAKCCTLSCPEEYAATIPDGYIQDGEACRSCSGDFYKIKPNPCNGYETCTNGAEDDAAFCLSGTEKKYDHCKSCTPNNPCTGYEFDSRQACSYDYASCNNGCGTIKYKCLECIPQAIPKGWTDNYTACPDGMYEDIMDTCNKRYYLCTTADASCRKLKKQLENTDNTKVEIDADMYCGNTTLKISAGQSLTAKAQTVLEFEDANDRNNYFNCALQLSNTYYAKPLNLENLTLRLQAKTGICIEGISDKTKQFQINLRNISIQNNSYNGYLFYPDTNGYNHINLYGDLYFSASMLENRIDFIVYDDNTIFNGQQGSRFNSNNIYAGQMRNLNLYDNAQARFKNHFDNKGDGTVNMYGTSFLALDTKSQKPSMINMYDNSRFAGKIPYSTAISKYSAASSASLLTEYSFARDFSCPFSDAIHHGDCINYFEITTPYGELDRQESLYNGNKLSCEDGIYECRNWENWHCTWEKISDTPYEVPDFNSIFSGSFWD